MGHRYTCLSSLIGTSASKTGPASQMSASCSFAMTDESMLACCSLAGIKCRSSCSWTLLASADWHAMTDFLLLNLVLHPLIHVGHALYLTKRRMCRCDHKLNWKTRILIKMRRMSRARRAVETPSVSDLSLVQSARHAGAKSVYDDASRLLDLTRTRHSGS